MVALTADLAHRCASLNPEFGMDAPASTPGVVLIDEVDLHLHPSWQQKVIDLLQEAFADAQFIVTTHSPQVLSTVHKESVRVIHHDESESRIALPPFQTRGVESADILAKVMSVDPIPRVREAGWLSDYREFIQDGRHQSSDAETLWSTLVEHFGVHHPVLDELSVLRRLQDFMEAEGLNGGGDD